MPSGKWPGESYEARIERLAGWGFVPCFVDDDWPMPKPPPFTPPDDEGEAEPHA